jgi:hypothetical protein
MFKTAYSKFSEAEPEAKPVAKSDPADPLEKEGHIKAAYDHLSAVVPDNKAAEAVPDDEAAEGEKPAAAAIEGTSHGGSRGASKSKFATRLGRK